MTTEKDEAQEQISSDQAAEAAAFEASFTGEPIKQPEPEPTQEPEKKDPEPTPEPVKDEPKPDAAPPAPSPAQGDPELRAEIRKLHGQFGALNDLVRKTMQTREAEGKPATLSAVELKRMKAEYPDMAAFLEEDLAHVMSGLKPQQQDPTEIDNRVSERVTQLLAAERANLRAELRTDAVTDRHESWKTDLWVGGELGKTRTPEYVAWLKTMPEAEAAQFESSDSPAYVSRKLDQFYDWKNKAAQAEATKKNRLAAAVTPTSGARASPQTMSDADAELKGFEQGFNQ